MGRSQPNIMIDVQAPVTHAAIVATMEREMGHPPRLVRTPDVCDRRRAKKRGCRAWWTAGHPKNARGRDTSTRQPG